MLERRSERPRADRSEARARVAVEPRRHPAAPGVPPHRGRRGDPAARRHPRRAGLGELAALGRYEDLWRTKLTISIGGGEISEDLRHWVNDGLMVFFFYVVGLEIRRELSMGELTDKREAADPRPRRARRHGRARARLRRVQRSGPTRCGLGHRRWPPTSPSCSARSRCSGPAARRSCGCSCSRSRSSTTSARSPSSRSSTGVDRVVALLAAAGDPRRDPAAAPGPGLARPRVLRRRARAVGRDAEVGRAPDDRRRAARDAHRRASARTRRPSSAPRARPAPSGSPRAHPRAARRCSRSAGRSHRTSGSRRRSTRGRAT